MIQPRSMRRGPGYDGAQRPHPTYKPIQPIASNAAAARRVVNYPAQVKRSAGLGEQEQFIGISPNGYNRSAQTGLGEQEQFIGISRNGKIQKGPNKHNQPNHQDNDRQLRRWFEQA